MTNWKNTIAFILSFLFFWQVLFAKNIQLVTSFYPLAFLIENIAPNSLLENLTNSDPHQFSPTPKNIISINQADLLIYFSQYLEFWATDIAKEKKKLSIEKNIPHLFFKLGKNQKQENHHQLQDPHIWLDIFAMSEITLFLGKELAKIDKENKEIYLQNAEKLSNKFLQLHQNYQTSLKNCLADSLITTHNFLGYLSRRYKFGVYAITGFSTLDQPSAKTILHLKKIANQKTNYILIENTISKKWADILLRETQLKSLPIDNLVWRQKKDYFARAKNNLQTLQKALNCN